MVVTGSSIEDRKTVYLEATNQFSMTQIIVHLTVYLSFDLSGRSKPTMNSTILMGSGCFSVDFNKLWLSFLADIDECASPETNECDTNAECSNTEGSYTCSCRVGYTGDGRSCAGCYFFHLSPALKPVTTVSFL